MCRFIPGRSISCTWRSWPSTFKAGGFYAGTAALGFKEPHATTCTRSGLRPLRPQTTKTNKPKQRKAQPGPPSHGETAMAGANGMSRCRSTCPRNVKFSTHGSEPWTSIEWQLCTRNVTPRTPDYFSRKQGRATICPSTSYCTCNRKRKNSHPRPWTKQWAMTPYNRYLKC